MLWGSKGRSRGRNKPHRHKMHELFICLNNNGTQFVDGGSCGFMKGRAFFLPEGSSHNIESERKTSADFAFVCFEHGHFLKSGNPQAQQAVGSLVQERQYFSGTGTAYLKENVRLILLLLDETNSSRPFASAKADCLLGELIINFFRSLNKESSGGKPENTGKIQLLLEKIQLQPEAEYTLSASARFAGMSITKFCNNFRRHTGTTLTGYITAARLKKTVDMLKASDMQVSAVAYACGFKNLGYFHRVFKKHYTTTPYALKRIFRLKGEFPRILKEY